MNAASLKIIRMKWGQQSVRGSHSGSCVRKLRNIPARSDSGTSFPFHPPNYCNQEHYWVTWAEETPCRISLTHPHCLYCFFGILHGTLKQHLPNVTSTSQGSHHRFHKDRDTSHFEVVVLKGFYLRCLSISSGSFEMISHHEAAEVRSSVDCFWFSWPSLFPLPVFLTELMI